MASVHTAHCATTDGADASGGELWGGGSWLHLNTDKQVTVPQVWQVISTLTSQDEGACFTHWSPIFYRPRQQPLDII